MSLVEYFSRYEKILRPKINLLPAKKAVSFFTKGRKTFLEKFINETPSRSISLPENLKIKLWDIEFNCPLFNAAGMFKNGKGYELCAAQSAGAFLAGTSTPIPRQGNKKEGIVHPFAAYPKSHAASNWMGLPNEGCEIVAKRLSMLSKKRGCPIGISLAASPNQEESLAMQGLIEGLKMFDKAGVDFIEINESCPNVTHNTSISEKELDAGEEILSKSIDISLMRRLEHINDKFLKNRRRNLPVILKLSTDIDRKTLVALLDIMLAMNYDGVNLGNTSTDYNACRTMIDKSEHRVFDYFVETFGGGISGAPLKQKSFDLSSFAAEYLKHYPPNREFNVIRTGGIERYEDITASQERGIVLFQWFTGYFENFSYYGHSIYSKFFK